MNFWNSKIQDVLDELKTSPSGLPEDRYNELLLHSNRNDSNNFKKKNPFVIFISQFKNPLILILLLVVLVSFFTKDNVDGFVILALLMVNAILGFWQEEKAQKSLEKLRKLIKMRSKVLRAGKIKIVEAEDIVLGDIIILNKGDYIPADIRLIESNNLIVNESSLTGESLEVEKDINSIPKDFEPQDIKNSVFQGTFVTEGNARGVVVAIGKETFLGRSVQIGDKKEEQTNFAKKFNQFAKLLFIFVLIITILAFAINVFLGRDVLASFILAVTLALGVTPETMPVILSVSLASAAMRLSGKNLLIKRLTVFEDLGNIDVICSDKTGTITTGVLQPSHFLDLNLKENEDVERFSLLCNANNPTVDSRIMPNSIDDALWNSVDNKLRKDLGTLKKVWDFDFDTRIMGVEDSNNVVYVKGAYESIIERSILGSEKKKSILEKLKSYEDQGGRLIGIGKKAVSKEPEKISEVKDLEIVGFVVLVDPPREKMLKEFHNLEKLNIVLKIISGDSENVTRSVCNKVGLEIVEDKIWEGEELEKLNDIQLEEVVNKYNVFTRVDPEEKLKIVEAIKIKGHVVGYVGDGVNDVGALKIADVGISVDSGVDVAKDCADVIILQRNLETIVLGVKEGRKLFNNTMKYIFGTISSSFGDVITITFASLFLPFLPLLPVQVILLGFLSDIQDLALSTDNVDEELISKPKNWDMSIFVRYVMFWGVISTLFDFAQFFVIRKITNSPEMFRTIWMIESILTALVARLAIRTPRVFFKSKPSTYLLVSSFISSALAIALTYLPIGAYAFGLVSPIPYLLVTAIGITIVYLIVLEVVKRGYFEKFLGVEYNTSILKSLLIQH